MGEGNEPTMSRTTTHNKSLIKENNHEHRKSKCRSHRANGWKRGRLALIPTRFISTTVDEVYQAMRNNPGLPNKDEAASLPKLVQKLNTKLQARLSVRFSQARK